MEGYLQHIPTVLNMQARALAGALAQMLGGMK